MKSQEIRRAEDWSHQEVHPHGDILTSVEAAKYLHLVPAHETSAADINRGVEKLEKLCARLGIPHAGGKSQDGWGKSSMYSKSILDEAWARTVGQLEHNSLNQPSRGHQGGNASPWTPGRTPDIAPEAPAA